MKNGTLLAIVLDRSGSMTSCQDEAQSGLRQFVASQQQTTKDMGEKCLLTLNQFNHGFERVVTATAIEEVDANSLVLEPGGMTALLDAVGRTITEIDADVERAGDNGPERVIMLILTDGHENSSRQFQHAQVRELVTSHQARGWDFVFIGADINAFDAGGSLGVSHDTTMQSSGASASNAYAMTASAVSGARMSRSAVGYNDAQRVGSMTPDSATDLWQQPKPDDGKPDGTEPSAKRPDPPAEEPTSSWH